jgi:hypothetical protein
MRNFSPAPGYGPSPVSGIGNGVETVPRGSAPGASAFVNGPIVDLGFWNTVLFAGSGPVTGYPAITAEVQAMRSLCVRPYHFKNI